MNIAYQALVIFLILLPGLFYRKAASVAGRFRVQRALADELAWSVTAAAITHCIAIIVFSCLAPAVGLRVDVESAMMHAIGDFGKDSEHLSSAIHAITDYPVWVMIYFASACLGALGVGFVVNHCRRRGMSATAFFDWFEDEPAAQRFRDWSKALGNPDKNKLEVPLLATVVEFGNFSYLYIGFLDDVHWSADGQPEAFVLTDVIRRPFDSETDLLEGAAVKYYEVLGTSLTIRASECKTLNVLIRYLELLPPQAN